MSEDRGMDFVFHPDGIKEKANFTPVK